MHLDYILPVGIPRPYTNTIHGLSVQLFKASSLFEVLYNNYDSPYIYYSVLYIWVCHTFLPPTLP